MKHQQVVPDYAAMVKTSGTCLCLVFSGWVLFKLVQAIFWLPGYLEKNQGHLYRQLEQRSGVCHPEEDGQKGESLPSRKSRTTKGDRFRSEGNPEDDEDVIQPSEEEKGENDAVESEVDTKKDK